MCPRKYGGLATQGSLFYVPFILQQKSKSIDWLSVAMFFPVEDFLSSGRETQYFFQFFTISS
jgi:hypothetical protein